MNKFDISDNEGVGSGHIDTGITNDQKQQQHTWVHDIFQAIVTRELKCLNCEAVSFLFLLVIYSKK